MIEIPESRTLAGQLNESIKGKLIRKVYTNTSPHKFAWFSGDPDNYNSLLSGKKVILSQSFGGMVEIKVEDIRLVFCDGTNIRYFENAEKLPPKHQLQLEFEDESSLICSIQMYGALWALNPGQTEGYNEIAREKMNPLSDEFDVSYFQSIYSEEDKKLSAKAFLATNQRIPGLGNGVLQDILFYANIHPKRKMNSLSEAEYEAMYQSIKSTLLEMSDNGGRDTEKTLYGKQGGYKTILSNKTKDTPCPVCNTKIVKEAYLGGNIYYCPECQRFE
jgi:formamidopyrimidine-DNA glycosylase